MERSVELGYESIVRKIGRRWASKPLTMTSYRSCSGYRKVDVVKGDFGATDYTQSRSMAGPYRIRVMH